MTIFESNLPIVIEELQAKDVAQDAKDVDLQNQINSEITARTDADNNLQVNIDAEAVVRADADNQLQTNINNEASARATEDQNLQEQITAEEVARADADSQLQNSINAETTARTNADETEAGVRASAVQDLQDQINALKNANFNPAGAVQYFARQTAPEGWLIADGSSVSRTGYADLFTAIGTTFGAGDGSTTFNLPDLRGEFIRGWDHGKGTDVGRTFGSPQLDQFQGHWHEVYDFSHYGFVNSNIAGGGPYNVARYNTNNAQNLRAKDIITDGVNGNPRIGNETRGRNIALLPCIKA